MYQPTASTNSATSIPNGHLSPPPSHHRPNFTTTSESESDLSEALDPSNTILPSIDHDDEQGGEDTYQATGSESSQEEDAIGFDDADYDMEDSPTPIQPPAQDTCSSSQTSSKLGKRKASVEEDDDMSRNPELWGLRRSVRDPHSSPS